MIIDYGYWLSWLFLLCLLCPCSVCIASRVTGQNESATDLMIDSLFYSFIRVLLVPVSFLGFLILPYITDIIYYADIC